MEKGKKYIEEGRIDGEKTFTKQGAIRRIKSILKDDKELLETLHIENVNKLSEDRLLDIAYNYYEISAIN